MAKDFYPAGRRANKFPAVEALQNHFWYGTELTDNQKEILQRLKFAWTNLCNEYTQRQIIPMLMENFNVSDESARQDIRAAIQLYGNVMKADKEGMRYVMYEKAMTIMERAIKKEDFKAASSALNTAMRLLRLDQEDPDMPDFERLEPHKYEIKIPHSVKEALLSLSKSPVLNLSKMPATFTEEAEYVIEEDGESETPDE